MVLSFSHQLCWFGWNTLQGPVQLATKVRVYDYFLEVVKHTSGESLYLCIIFLFPALPHPPSPPVPSTTSGHPNIVGVKVTSAAGGVAPAPATLLRTGSPCATVAIQGVRPLARTSQWIAGTIRRVNTITLAAVTLAVTLAVIPAAAPTTVIAPYTAFAVMLVTLTTDMWSRRAGVEVGLPSLSIHHAHARSSAKLPLLSWMVVVHHVRV